MTLSGHSILKQCKDFWPISPAKKKIHSTLLMLDARWGVLSTCFRVQNITTKMKLQIDMPSSQKITSTFKTQGPNKST